MKIYRVAKKKFVEDLSGEGARLYGGRWNKKGQSMLYFSEHLSLCVLELLTRIDYEFLSQDYAFIEVEISERSITTISDISAISKNWRADPPTSATIDFGSKWLSNSEDLAMYVPSAVLPRERNVLVNPNHLSASKLKILHQGPLELDPRMIR
ncbi:MAG: RES family NAD+ phosphorylase [Bacteroidota bacterium]